MARKEPVLLGIDLHEHEIRVVQVKSRANKISLTKIGRAQMPLGAIVRGKVVQPSSVAVALRLLLNSMEIGSGSKAVVGVLGDTTALRTLPIPPVPDSDLAQIVSGEVEHYGLVRTAGGTHAFLRLYPPPRSIEGDQPRIDAVDKSSLPDADKPVHVTIVALEEDVISTLRQSIEEANVTIDSFEPTQYAMYRSIMVASGNSSSAFGLMMNPSNTDMAIAYKGNLVAYRRVDIGSRSILLHAPAPVEVGYVDINRDVFVDDFSVSETEGYHLNYAAIESLSIEVQRTLDYYQREFPNVSIGDRLHLAIDDPRLEPLAEELGQRLGLNIEAVQPIDGSPENPEYPSALGTEYGPIFASAFGLAVQGAVMSKVPRLDLFTKERTAVLKAETKRNFRGSVITSILAAMLGVAGYVVYSKQISALDSYTKGRLAIAAALRSKIDKTVQYHQQQAEQFKALRHEGVPLSAIMDFIAGSLEKGTGLSQVAVMPDLSVTIDGDSTNNGGMVTALQTLQRCPVFVDLQMTTFKQVPSDNGFGVEFQFKGKTVSIDRVEMDDGKTVEKKK